ncbi:MAG: HEPN domain-containing protein [Candidatus Nealsonbacteria bacterium]|nr:HEPN domain-containing protein [Candidatus Nealsonbacteria bacterium]
MAEVDFLKKRAEGFLANGKYDISKKEWPLAAFHLEQASQLYLKYYLYLKIRKFPKTHSLKELLKGIGKVYKKQEKVEKILKEKASTIGDLEQAYLTVRYLPVEFSKYQIENMLNFTEDLIKFLENCEKRA